MNISNFSKFLQDLNESRTVDLPILDVVIDDQGIVHNGEEADLVKGRVQRETGRLVTRILGTDNIEYPAGIDKNGNVVALNTDTENKALNSKGEVIKVPKDIQKKYRIPEFYYQSPDFDYYSVIPIIPTGWVNVKVDMEIVKRVKRYAKTLGTSNRGHESFLSKLSEFERLSTQTRSQQYISRLKRNTIQKEMSAILLLHYINEIKDFFNPSQGGFLFESFVAGLIPDSRVKEDNSPVDIKTTTGERYQLKFVDSKAAYADLTKDIVPGRTAWLEHYMIALKYVDRIDMYIIDGRVLEQRYNDGTIGNLMTAGGKPDPDTGKVKSGPKFSMERVRTLDDPTLIKKFSIELTDIDGRIKNLGESLKQSLKELYDELAKFQFNVETIITGVNEKGKVVRDPLEFDVYHLSAEKNISNLAIHLKRLVSDINK